MSPDGTHAILQGLADSLHYLFLTLYSLWEDLVLYVAYGTVYYD